jgi:hypothetical protein
MKTVLTYILRVVLVIVPLAIGVAAGWQTAAEEIRNDNILQAVAGSLITGMLGIGFAALLEMFIYVVAYGLLFVIRGGTWDDFGEALNSSLEGLAGMFVPPKPPANSFGTPYMQPSDEHVRPRQS